MDSELHVPSQILERWHDFSGRPSRRFGSGLINRTYLVDGRSGRAVLQKLHPIFAGSVNEDIDAVTAHLERRGLVSPRPIRADDGGLWCAGEDGRPWRALTYVEGESFDRVGSPDLAREAGRLVARFHRAVFDLKHDYRHVRAGVHDTPRHLETLRHALEEHSDHRLIGEVRPLADQILARFDELPDMSRFPPRHAHGDLKISNLLFRDGRGLCLVDLDTLGLLPWPYEMGDALRSWANPRGEDVAEAALDPAIFSATLEGYGEIARPAGLLSREEALGLVDGLETICLELSTRFAADALNESYFGFDASRFPARGEHNLLRARGQLSLFESVRAQEPRLREACGRLLAG